MRAFDPRSDNIKKRFAETIRSRTHLKRRRTLQVSATIFSGNDAHVEFELSLAESSFSRLFVCFRGSALKGRDTIHEVTKKRHEIWFREPSGNLKSTDCRETETRIFFDSLNHLQGFRGLLAFGKIELCFLAGAFEELLIAHQIGHAKFRQA